MFNTMLVIDFGSICFGLSFVSLILSLYFVATDNQPQCHENVQLEKKIGLPVFPQAEQIIPPAVIPAVEIPERLSVLVRNKKGESHYRIVTRKQAIANARFISKGKGTEYGAFYYAAGNRFFECWEYAPLSEVESRKKALMVSADDLFVQL